MDGWFDGWAAGDVAAAVGWTLAALVLLVLVLAGLRMLRGQPLAFTLGNRNHHRISVVDSAVVDRQHRLILVRRDNVEHLVLIGGSRDLVIESAIPVAHAAAPGPVPEIDRPRRHAERPHDRAAMRPGSGGRVPPPREMRPEPRRDHPQRRPPEPPVAPPAAAAQAAAPAVVPIAAAAAMQASEPAPVAPEPRMRAAEPQPRPPEPVLVEPETTTTPPPLPVVVDHAPQAVGGEMEAAPVQPAAPEPEPAVTLAAAGLPEPSLDMPVYVPSIDETPPVAGTQEPAPAEGTPPYWPPRFEVYETAGTLEETTGLTSRAELPDDGDTDDALLRELELTLDRDRAARGHHERDDAGPALNEEMDRLLGELAGERR